jgi:formate dehydrogenase subunit gamma
MKLSSMCAGLLALLLCGAALAQPQDPIQAQRERQMTQPGNNAPVWNQVQSGAPVASTTVRGREMEVLIQPPARFMGQSFPTTAGEAWRQFRNGPVTFYGGWALVLIVVLIGALYLLKGPVKLHDRPTGRMVPRFSVFERWVHWTTAISFVVLGLTGLMVLFGKHVLLPIMGYTVFAWLTQLSKWLHNFVAPLFMVAVLVMIVMWLRDNLPRAYDWQWFRGVYGFFMRGKHIPSGRFNAGEKTWFWFGVIGLSILVSASGLILLFPNFDQTRATMQDAWAVHVIAALIYIAMSLGHIYMGTIGVQGSYRAMRDGEVDETWAREHHGIWYDEVKSRRPAAPGGAVPAGAPHMKEKP